MNLTVVEWMNREFTEGSRPRPNVVWRWIREGRMPATKLGKRYYIPSDYTLAGRTGDPLADKILESHHGTPAQARQQSAARTPLF